MAVHTCYVFGSCILSKEYIKEKGEEDVLKNEEMAY
jgi:hypothetical protein